ncbi:MAG: gliding motility-associated C-terminal domain-containing protein [Bacteroidota bacterium]
MSLIRKATHRFLSGNFCRKGLVWGLFLLIANSVCGQAPNISYPNPQVYTVNIPLTTLFPTNTGGIVPAYIYQATSRFAGSGTAGSTDGASTVAKFNAPQSITKDAAGNFYVPEYNNKIIRKITANGVVSTFAGILNTPGNTNGSVFTATFMGPTSVAFDSGGNMFVADYTGHTIRKITANGIVTTFAGTGTSGFTNGPVATATFNEPYGLAIDANDNIYVADLQNHAIRKIDNLGQVTTLAGNGTFGQANGTGPAARFTLPGYLTTDAAGNVYVSDGGNNAIRKITPGGVVTTIAGNLPGVPPALADIGVPGGLKITPGGNLYFVSLSKNKIFEITSSGSLILMAGDGTSGSANGVAATFKRPQDVEIDAEGNLFIADQDNNMIRKVNATGYSISPQSLPPGIQFDVASGAFSGTPTAAWPSTNYTVTGYNIGGSSTTTVNITVNATNVTPPAGNPPDISYVTPQVYTATTAITPLQPTNNGGTVPANVYGQVTNFPVTPVGFNTPTSLAFDAAGNLYVAEFGKRVISKITPAGIVTTFAGKANVSSNIDGPLGTETFGAPSGIVFDSQGNMFVADNLYNTIRKITISTGIVSTFAGSGSAGLLDGTGTAAQFKQPYGLAIDANDNIYVADQGNNAIRMITKTGVVTTLAGTGALGITNGPAATATFRGPTYVAVNTSGTVYVADQGINNMIRIISGGQVTTLSGSNINYNGIPNGMRTDATGNLYFAAGVKHQIFKLTPNGSLISLAGNPGGAAGTANGIGPAASFSTPADIVFDNTGNMYIADKANNRLRKLNLTGYSIDQTLPPGLTFDATTGIISGTPTAPSVATNYTITAYNISGSSSTTLQIQVNGLPAPPKILAPQISYASPQTYSPGVTITPLAPTNTGGAVPATIYGETTEVASGFNRSTAVATDPLGNIYVTTTGSNQIQKIDAITGTVTIVAGNTSSGNTNGPAAISNFANPIGIVFDSFGNIYVSDQTNNAIRKITPGGTVSTFAGSVTSTAGKFDGIGNAATFSAPRGLAIDASDNIYVADFGNNLIRKIDTKTALVSTVFDAGTLKSPSGVGIDASGNLYIADADNNRIQKVTGNGDLTTIPIPAGTLKSPRDVKVDGSGNIYVTDQLNQRVVRITPANIATTLATFTTTIVGAVLDGLGNLYIGDNATKVMKVVVSGYQIDKVLPLGLSFDQKTGIISGKPVAPSSMQTYTITAYNGGGSSTFRLNLEVANTSATTITFNTPALKTNADNTVTPSVTTNNDEAPVTYTSDNPAVISVDANGVLHRVGAGTVTITASQGATAHFTAGSATTTATFKLSQQIIFPAIAAKTLCSTDFSSGATSATSATHPITYTSSNTAVATIDNSGIIHITRGGTTIITASQVGDASFYDDAAPVSQTLVVTEGLRPIVSVTPNNSATPNNLTICAGASVTFTAAVSNLALLTNPTYQWQVNGSNVGTNSNTYTSSLITGADIVKCTVTNNAACSAFDFGTSPAFTITPMSALSITIQSSANGAVCSGTAITFTATPNYTAAGNIYQWYLNGAAAGTNSSTYTGTTFNDGDKVTCTFTNSSTPCLVSSTANSTSLTVNITAPASPAPTVTIAESANNVYEGTLITFTATPLNTIGAITYQWQVNGDSAGTNSHTFTSSTFLNNDKVTCTILSGGCAAPATSAPVTLTIKPPLKILPSNTFTPNGDGINDLWTITGLLSYPNCLVNIYSRNGELVYQSKGYAKPWDGVYKGSNLPSGTYYYVIDLNNNRPKVSGYIAIIR